MTTALQKKMEKTEKQLSSKVRTLLKRIEKRLQSIDDQFKQLADVELADAMKHLSTEEFRIVKRHLKRWFSVTTIDNMLEYARGGMPWHMVSKEWNYASVWRRLPKPAQETLNDPNATVDVRTDGGIKVVPVKDLIRNPTEFNRAVQAGAGILPPAKQKLPGESQYREPVSRNVSDGHPGTPEDPDFVEKAIRQPGSSYVRLVTKTGYECLMHVRDLEKFANKIA